MKLVFYKKIERNDTPVLEVEKRFEAIDKEVRAILDSCYEKARDLIGRCRPGTERIM